VTTRSASLSVAPARANPYPTITSAGVYRLDRAYIGDQFIGCIDYAVAAGAVIDLRDLGCSFSIGSPPQRYSAQVEVDNPAGEALTYTWRLYVGTGKPYESLYISATNSSEASFELYDKYNSGLGTDSCHVTLTVNAP